MAACKRLSESKMKFQFETINFDSLEVIHAVTDCCGEASEVTDFDGLSSKDEEEAPKPLSVENNTEEAEHSDSKCLRCLYRFFTNLFFVLWTE